YRDSRKREHGAPLSDVPCAPGFRYAKGHRRVWSGKAGKPDWRVAHPLWLIVADLLLQRGRHDADSGPRKACRRMTIGIRPAADAAWRDALDWLPSAMARHDGAGWLRGGKAWHDEVGWHQAAHAWHDAVCWQPGGGAVHARRLDAAVPGAVAPDAEDDCAGREYAYTGGQSGDGKHGDGCDAHEPAGKTLRCGGCWHATGAGH